MFHVIRRLRARRVLTLYKDDSVERQRHAFSIIMDTELMALMPFWFAVNEFSYQRNNSDALYNVFKHV